MTDKKFKIKVTVEAVYEFEVWALDQKKASEKAIQIWHTAKSDQVRSQWKKHDVASGFYVTGPVDGEGVSDAD